ncbi:general stress protein [Pantoea sp. LMR881]|uniref:general stress protein n=1 Tax=Pantoea sp. LMR881 TaxID=3014336 RepID=UPI0022AEB3D3|nr:general stress protein [Pantoea sp. LMR881]MCZ4061056.1 general stress protein [Pantoea sp. LMR881]
MTTRRGGAGNFAENPQRAAEAGRKGGQVSSGNFRNSHERAVLAGRKGGAVSRRGKGRAPDDTAA